jgi:hypothetical protein
MRCDLSVRRPRGIAARLVSSFCSVNCQNMSPDRGVDLCVRRLLQRRADAPCVTRGLFDCELRSAMLVLITFPNRRREVPEAGELDTMKEQASFPSEIDTRCGPFRLRRLKRSRRHSAICIETQSHGEGARAAQPEIFHPVRFMLGVALIAFQAKEFSLVEPSKWNGAVWVGAF